MFLETLPEVVGVGLGDAAAFAVVPGRDGRQLPLGASEDVAVVLLQSRVLARGESFALAPGDAAAGLLQ